LELLRLTVLILLLLLLPHCSLESSLLISPSSRLHDLHRGV
jgi:hypothetical protein